MSLISLSRSTLQAKQKDKRKVSADEFIQEAVDYANGVVVPIAQTEAETAVDAKTEKSDEHTPMRRATFTLTEDCIKQLQQLSDQSGIPKSKLIRMWIKRSVHLDND